MKIATDSVICRIVEADGLISVTHTSKEQSGRRISDIHSVADLLQTLPSLTEPFIEAIPYETEYYDKWARVSRNDAASRASTRPVTVTVKSWTLLHSVPTAPQPSIDTPSSPRRQAANSNHNPSITTCKSLDSIIEHYNKLFPNENEETKCDVKVAKHKDKSAKGHGRGKEKHHLDNKQRNSGGNVTTINNNLAPNSNNDLSRDNKATPRAISPKRKLSVSSSMDRSAVSPERSSKTDKTSKKNSLQVPLPTGLVYIQWPSALPASDNCHKLTQFPTCSPKKSNYQIIPRIKTPDLREQDMSSPQRNNKVAAKNIEELKLMQISSSSLVASQNSRRHSFDRRPDKITRHSPGLSPEPKSAYLRRYSTQSNYTLSTEDPSSDYRSTSVHESSMGGLGELTTLSPASRRNCNSGNVLHSRERKCTLNVPVDVLAPINNSPRELNQDSFRQELHSDCSNIGNQSDVTAISSEKITKSHRKKRSKSRKLLHEDPKHRPEERERSSRSTQPKHNRNGPPMVQFLDLNDLQAIFNKAAKVRRPSEMLPEDVCSLELSM